LTNQAKPISNPADEKCKLGLFREFQLVNSKTVSYNYNLIYTEGSKNGENYNVRGGFVLNHSSLVILKDLIEKDKWNLKYTFAVSNLTFLKDNVSALPEGAETNGILDVNVSFYVSNNKIEFRDLRQGIRITSNLYLNDGDKEVKEYFSLKENNYIGGE
jgi:hypothetical protein